MPKMWELIQIVGGGVVGVVFGLSQLSRRFPHVAWLQHFRLPRTHLTEQQQARMSRRSSIYAGLQLILLGSIFPLGYVVLTVMTFNVPTRGVMALVLAGSVVCVLLGVAAIVMSGRR